MAEPQLDVPLVAAVPVRELPAESRLPRLRLHHFFALTAVMAVMLAVSGPQYDFGKLGVELPHLPQIAFTGSRILYSILASIAITVVGYGIAWRRQGIVFFNQPGHWLLVEIAITSGVGLLPQLAYRAIGDIDPTVGVQFPWAVFVVISIVSVAFLLFRVGLNIYFGWKKCRERRWSWVFYLKAFAAIVQILGDLMVLVMISRALLIDRREIVRRDFIHRCGVAIQLALTSLTVFLTLFFMLSFTLGWWASG